MKLFVLVLLGLLALVYSEEKSQHYKVADKTFLEKQKKVLHLFNHINQPSHYKEHVDIAKSFSFRDNKDHYENQDAVKHYGQYLKYHQLLPKGDIFSVFHIEHLEEAISLFKVFYYAKDFDTFYKTAIWAREHVNEGLFLYSFSVALVHRQDTYGIILPPIYEIYPHYFFNTEVIHEASKYKQVHHSHENQNDQQHGYKGYTIEANYSGHYLNLHPEQSLSYYLEDVGINSFYYYYNLYYPFWLDGKEFGLENDKRGELYLYVQQQILARFYLERLSNGFGEVPYFNWELPIETPYYPSLEYPNGLEFPSRPAFAKLQEYFFNYGQSWSTKGPYGYSYTFVHDYERRINDAIDTGYVLSKDAKKFIPLESEDGVNTLGNIVEGNYDSPHHKFYGSFQIAARHLLGYSYQPLDSHHVVPSALEHFETSLRDPVYYQYLKRVVGKYQRYKLFVPSYTEHDLEFPGVKVAKFEVDNLETYDDYFYADISNAVFDSEEELEHDSFHIRAKQYRLNHKPFTYKITINSEKETKASVKVFIGPKYDDYGRYINISQNRLNFVELQHFTYDLKSGENVITKNSYESKFYGPDRISYDELHKQVEEAYTGQKEFHIDGSQNYFSFPQRYLLPKGSHGGTAFQFYVFVYPYKPYKGKGPEVGEYYYPKVGSGGVIVDEYPLGYPFDRFIKYEDLFYEIPNSYFHEVKIYHKEANEVNAPHH